MAVMNLTLDWRQKAENGLTWRLATEADMPRLNYLWATMDRKLGKQDKPKLFELPVLLALVAEDENGVIVGGMYGEAVCDFTGIGTDRRTAESIDGLFPMLQDFLFSRSIRVARVLVPRRLAKGMKILLPRMVDITHSFASFVYLVRL